ncbi:MAG: 50S ribosomal protein L3 [Desulfurococcaceae archaeon]
MGHRKTEAPRHGSLGVRPRKRASRIVPRIKKWPSESWFEIVVKRIGVEEASKLGIVVKPVLLAYPVYKAGMSHVILIDNRPHTYTSGREVFRPVTILDSPPILILGIRGYGYDETRGLYTIGEVWKSPVESLVELYEKNYSENIFMKYSVKDIVRKYLKGLRKTIPSMVKPVEDSEYGYRFIDTNWDKKLEDLRSEEIVDIRAIVSTIPILSGIGKKKPEILEIKVGGGDLSDRFKYCESILGRYVTVKDVLVNGQYVDVIGVTKGKGFQGVIKRFGVKELPRWHKHRKGSRKIGSRSPGFGTMSETPQAGQTGFHRRTEYNKRVLKIGDYGWEIVPKGGFLGYGLIYGNYVMLEGSVIGPRKRLLVLRHPIRPPIKLTIEPPRIVYYSHESKQGV